ncbi:MAG TPA: CapA family protein [Pseudogracilibacillus sp.]|nr:CapA family protein [Pseudogracilibacillus sp.]
MQGYRKEDIEKVIPGYWYRTPKDVNWLVETVTISRGQLNIEKEKRSLFIAIDSYTWHKGSKNSGIYSGWKDTHKTIGNFQQLIAGIIVQKPLPNLDENIPQYVTENTYDAIRKLANFTYSTFLGKTIGITGTAGKSTSKNLLNVLLKKCGTVEATRGNHNTRTGVPLTVACAITKPNYLIIESAISGLWMKPHGIMKEYPPDIALITSIDGGQNKDAFETAKIKSKIAEGMNKKGIVVVNNDAKEIETLLKYVKEFNEQIITYGWGLDSDSRIVNYIERKGYACITANILGEEVSFNTKLLGEKMALNIIGVLTVIKKLDIPLHLITPHIQSYEPGEGVQTFEEVKLKTNQSFTLINDSWNATGIAMIEAIRMFHNQATFYNGKKIAILGRIENLGESEARRQHEALAEPLIQSDVDIVFAHGPEMKYLLNKLPETLIGGYFENIERLMEAVVPIIEPESLILLKGSPRSSDFKHAVKHLKKELKVNHKRNILPKIHPFSTDSGAITFDMETNEIAGTAGNIHAKQNQGVGNLLLIDEILQRIFSKTIALSFTFKPGNQALKEGKSLNALRMKENQPLTLHTLLTAALVRNAPDALLMLANQVIGSNRRSVNIIREKALALDIPKDTVLNLTGRRVSKQEQVLTLPILYKAAKQLFNQYSKELGILSQPFFQYRGNVFKQPTNLFSLGKISHGIFYGYLDSIGATLSHVNEKKYITVVIGATDPYERDQLIMNSLEGMETEKKKVAIKKSIDRNPYKITILGDTYFGELYTDIRKKHGRTDSLQKYNRNYSFDKIRSIITESDYTVCNFEAAISEEREHPLKAAKPFILYADGKKTIPSLKKEKIDLVTLGNNHLMDCGIEGLKLTLEQLNEGKIEWIGSGMNQLEAEMPHIQYVNGQRIAIFNGYWYRNPMYYNFDFYAIGNKPGVACLSGNMKRNIQNEKNHNPKGLIIVIPHWGVDFKPVLDQQRAYAYALLDAGADVIIGHGAHMMQEIEKYDDKYIVYSIGNGVFNSNGEYNRRHVAPYSFIAQLVQDKGWKLRLYPIYTNNLKTFWQPSFVNDEQFSHCNQILKTYGSINLTDKTDEGSRHYFELRI